MKLIIENRLEQIFDRRNGNIERIDVYEIISDGPFLNIFMIVINTFDETIFSNRIHHAFDTECEAFAWLDENGYRTLSLAPKDS